MHPQDKKAEVTRIFEYLDTDKEGKITFKNLKRICHEFDEKISD